MALVFQQLSVCLILPHTTCFLLLLQRMCENLGQEEIYSLLKSMGKAPCFPSLPFMVSSGSEFGCNQRFFHSVFAFG